MAAGIVAALASAAGGLTIAGATYWFTKQRDREAELRKEKLGYYKEFTASLSGILGAEGTAEGQRRFAKACNDLNPLRRGLFSRRCKRFRMRFVWAMPPAARTSTTTYYLRCSPRSGEIFASHLVMTKAASG